MKEYEKLKLKIIFFQAADVITASRSDIDEDWTDENEWGN